MTLFFPRIQETSPFFHLINELDRASRPQQSRCQPKPERTFTPSFDVKETKDTYQLYGELPGLVQSDVNIEWADDKTITISGRSERKYKARSPAPAVPAVEVTQTTEEQSSASEDGFEEITNEQASYKQPSVEDEEGNTSSATETEKVAEPEQQQQEAPKAPEAPAHKYWIAERSVGTFSRTFQFPIRVENDNVKASLKNGILSITIPKAKPLEPKKIVIQ